jgi:hypothetical protein
VKYALADEYFRKITDDLTEQIDFEILYSLLEWTRIDISSWVAESDVSEFRRWLDKCCIGHRAGRGGVWFFELEEDATAFALKWC